jgi:hypothetical protein
MNKIVVLNERECELIVNSLTGLIDESKILIDMKDSTAINIQKDINSIIEKLYDINPERTFDGFKINKIIQERDI